MKHIPKLLLFAICALFLFPSVQSQTANQNQGGSEVLRYEDVEYNVEGEYPSDHHPIYVEFELPDHE